MEFSKLKVGRKVRYESRKHVGTGRVSAIEHKKTGAWVTVMDSERAAFVTVRPSQVKAAQ